MALNRRNVAPTKPPDMPGSTCQRSYHGGIDVPKRDEFAAKARKNPPSRSIAIGRRPAFATTGLAIAATRGGLPDRLPRCLYHLSCHLLSCFGGGHAAGNARSVLRLRTRWVALACRVCGRCVGAREPRCACGNRAPSPCPMSSGAPSCPQWCGLPAVPQPMGCGVFVYVHIPKSSACD